MTPIRLFPSPFSPIQVNEDPDDLLTLKPTYPLSTSCAPQREKRDDGSNQPEEAEEEEKSPDQADPGFSTSGCGEDHLSLRSCPLILGSGENEDNSPSSLKPVIHKQEDGVGDQCNNGSVKWMSSKMRLMKKMANPDQTVSLKPSSNQQAFKSRQRSPPPCDNDSTKNSPGNKIRVCSDCNTTKTPLWRSGPQGPKSLCNACGIRQRKARRAMAAAANGSLLSVETSMRSTNKEIKEKRSSRDYSSQYKKRCKLGGPRSRKKIRFDEFTISLSKNSAFHQVFPQDEKEAAILLMALSCGLVRG
ncbi:putative GATA transcription factor 22 isoform X2 [Aristolochia californica]|uniref:putative GATA transcription factor 22 isoform X2 n=1 Tax=Aristolochia californica TaxID=171875 RepID=UPI0035E28419